MVKCRANQSRSGPAPASARPRFTKTVTASACSKLEAASDTSSPHLPRWEKAAQLSAAHSHRSLICSSDLPITHPGLAATHSAIRRCSDDCPARNPSTSGDYHGFDRSGELVTHQRIPGPIGQNSHRNKRHLATQTRQRARLASSSESVDHIDRSPLSHRCVECLTSLGAISTKAFHKKRIQNSSSPRAPGIATTWEKLRESKVAKHQIPAQSVDGSRHRPVVVQLPAVDETKPRFGCSRSAKSSQGPPPSPNRPQQRDTWRRGIQQRRHHSNHQCGSCVLVQPTLSSDATRQNQVSPSTASSSTPRRDGTAPRRLSRRHVP